MIVYPEEAGRVTERVTAGKWHTIPQELELIGQQIASLREGGARKVHLSMLGYEDARRQDHRVDDWMLLAENGALSAHGFISEDGPKLPKEEGQEAAQKGGEVLEGEIRGWMRIARAGENPRECRSRNGDRASGRVCGGTEGRGAHPECAGENPHLGPLGRR
jgi:hypothetical protein